MKIFKNISDILKSFRNFPAIRITLYYVIFGFSWILLSDKVLLLIVKDPGLASQLQTYKGWFYILITAFLLYHLVSDSIQREKEMRRDLDISARKYQSIFDNFRDIYFEIDPQGHILEVSPSINEYYGYFRNQLVGKHISELFLFDENKQILDKIFNESINKNLEISLVDVNGDIKFCSVNTKKVFAFDDNIKIIGSIHDITSRKKNEEFLQKLNIAIEQSPNITIVTDTKGNIEYVNPSFTAITGYEKEEAIGENPRILKSKSYHNTEFYKEIWETITHGKIWRGLICNNKKDGSEYFESAVISPLKDKYGDITHYVKVSDDVTELRQNRIDLEKTLDAKEFLLQELYHRTKNNMQIISSILKMENRFTTQKAIKPFLKNLNNRILALSLIHDKIYHNGDIKNISLKNYLVGFVPYILNDYESLPGEVDLQIDISNNVCFNANVLISIGLLVNEMVSLSLFDQPNNLCSSIEIKYQMMNESHHLLYKDSVRKAYDFIENNDQYTSIKLINALVNQLKGELIFNDETGYVVIAFKEEAQRTFNQV